MVKNSLDMKNINNIEWNRIKDNIVFLFQSLYQWTNLFLCVNNKIDLKLLSFQKMNTNYHLLFN